MRILIVAVAVVVTGCGAPDTSGTGGGGGATGGGGGGAAACGPSNCLGCCFNGACQPGSTAAACGKNGASCSACATNFICKTEQTCGVDPDSTWKVQPTAARITASHNGAAWDADVSAPDVIVRMACDSTATTFTSVTPEVQSYTPTWTTGGCTAKASVLLSKGIVFQLYDVDAVNDDTITTPLALVPGDSEFSGGTIGVGSRDGMESLTFTLTRQ